jgi:hypothetical protein
MRNSRGLIRYAFLLPIIILTLICVLSVQKAEGISSVELNIVSPVGLKEISSINTEKWGSPLEYEIPIYDIPISEVTQREIWKLSEREHFSYELILAIYQAEGIASKPIDEIQADIRKLVDYRDYWTERGFPDEVVFDLVLLSQKRGIEGCITFMEQNNSFNLDSYIQKVTNFKYYLEERPKVIVL